MDVGSHQRCCSFCRPGNKPFPRSPSSLQKQKLQKRENQVGPLLSPKNARNEMFYGEFSPSASTLESFQASRGSLMYISCVPPASAPHANTATSSGWARAREPHAKTERKRRVQRWDLPACKHALITNRSLLWCVPRPIPTAA